MKEKGRLYLVPVTLGDNDNVQRVIPSYNNTIVTKLTHFIVEDLKSARRFLKKIDRNIDIDKLTFFELNQHTKGEEFKNMLNPLLEGVDVGLMSEAGVPCVADPGANIVAMAQHAGIAVTPLVGPSSIIMSLMASGFSGQNFAFVGYLPVENGKRNEKIKELERRAYKEDQTQIFIETPYRNMKMFEALLENCNPETKICVGVDITLSSEWIATQRAVDWKKTGSPDLSKRFVVFLISKN